MVRITFDPAKRAATLERRGLDFVDAGLVFAGRHATAPDQRFDYGELRFITVGESRGRLVVIVRDAERERATDYFDEVWP